MVPRNALRGPQGGQAGFLGRVSARRPGLVDLPLHPITLWIEGPVSPFAYPVENPSGSLKSCYTADARIVPNPYRICQHGAEGLRFFGDFWLKLLILLVKPQ
jgi:hypothetical protein